MFGAKLTQIDDMNDMIKVYEAFAIRKSNISFRVRNVGDKTYIAARRSRLAIMLPSQHYRAEMLELVGDMINQICVIKNPEEIFRDAA